MKVLLKFSLALGRWVVICNTTNIVLFEHKFKFIAKQECEKRNCIIIGVKS